MKNWSIDRLALTVPGLRGGRCRQRRPERLRDRRPVYQGRGRRDLQRRSASPPGSPSPATQATACATFRTYRSSPATDSGATTT